MLEIELYQISHFQCQSEIWVRNYPIAKIASITARIIACLTSYSQFNIWFISYIVSSKMTFLQFRDPLSGVDFLALELFTVSVGGGKAGGWRQEPPGGGEDTDKT